MTIYWIQNQCILLLGEQVLTIFLYINRVRLNWNCIVYDVQNATYSSRGAPCPARDLFPWLNKRVKVHISVWTIREYPKRHSSYLSDSGDTFSPMCICVHVCICCQRVLRSPITRTVHQGRSRKIKLSHQDGYVVETSRQHYGGKRCMLKKGLCVLELNWTNKTYYSLAKQGIG